MMKQLAAIVLGVSFVAAPALANDLETQCVAYASETSGDASGCSCLAKAADGAMTEELMAIQSEADIEALSDASKGAIASCWPEAY